MLLTFHADLEEAFVVYDLTQLPTYVLLTINSFAFLYILTN